MDILPGYRTDHFLISLGLSLNQIKRGTGYWKFNNILSKNEGFISQMIFIRSLYAAKEVEETNLEILLNYSDIPKLSSEMSLLLEGPLSPQIYQLMYQ